MVLLLQQWNRVSSFMSPLLRLSCCSAILSSIFPQGIVPLFEPRPRLVRGKVGICTVFDVTANTVAISFVFVNYCPNID